MKIREDFKKLIPSLSQEEYGQLEKNIVADGCRDPLVAWGDILIDGHNRFEICQRHGIPFQVERMEFPDESSAVQWIITNQFGRRNISLYDRANLALKLKPVFAERARENQAAGADLTNTGCQNSDKAIMPVDTKKEIAKIAGVSHDTIAKVEKIEAVASPEVKAKISQGEISIHKAYQDIRREEAREEIPVTPPKALSDKYSIIYADPPWRYEFSETKSREIENQYPTMTLEDIKSIEVPCEDNAVLFLWATAPKLREALEVMEAWGFTYRTCAVWDKEKIGMGYWFRGQHELLLLGLRGKHPTPQPANRVTSMYREPRGKHSKKPDHYYSMIESMFPGERYLELFARQKHNERWEVWGNQVQ